MKNRTRTRLRRISVVELSAWALSTVALAACGASGPTAEETTGTQGSAVPGGRPVGTASINFTPDERMAAALPRGGQSSFAIHAFAGATCTLQDAKEAPGAAQHLAFYADDDGVVRVTLEHSDPTVEVATLALYCRDDAGRMRTYALDVTVSDGAVAQAPAPISREGKRTLPRLEGGSMSLGAAELMAKGYPPRPDPAKSPASYARWLQIVESEPIVIEPRRTVDLGVAFGGEQNTGDWCGFVIDSAPSTPAFFDVGGKLLLPGSVAFPTSDHGSATIALWVGFDGHNEGNGVVQNGAAINASYVGGVAAVRTAAFYEWASLANPGATLAHTVPGFTVNLSDDLEVWTYVFTNVGLAYFYFDDLTQNVTMTEYLSIPPGVSFSGHEAEWVLEWPQGGGSNGNGVLDFGFAGIQYAEAYDNGNNMHTMNSDSSFQVDMVDPASADLLANAVGLPSSSTAGSILIGWNDWN